MPDFSALSKLMGGIADLLGGVNWALGSISDLAGGGGEGEPTLPAFGS